MLLKIAMKMIVEYNCFSFSLGVAKKQRMSFFRPQTASSGLNNEAVPTHLGVGVLTR